MDKGFMSCSLHPDIKIHCLNLKGHSMDAKLSWRFLCKHALNKKAIIHQVTTMLITSKMFYFGVVFRSDLQHGFIKDYCLSLKHVMAFLVGPVNSKANTTAQIVHCTKSHYPPDNHHASHF